MVDKLYESKNLILDRIHRTLSENNAERFDIAEMDKLVDMVKDLADAEKNCWESEYYHAVTDAMDNTAGYSPMDQSRRMSYSGRSGWQNQYGSGYSRRGYGNNYRGHLDALRMEMQNADPKEREQIMHELANMGMM